MPLLYSLLYLLLLGILAHFIGEAIPASWFHPTKGIYRCWKWEKGGSVYNAIGIAKWKNKLPDLSRVLKDMVPKTVSGKPTAESLERFAIETCRAEIVHDVLCLCSIPIYFFWWNIWGILIPVLYTLCNIPFILIQRYNRPVLVRLAQRLKERETKIQNESADSIL